MSKVPEIVAVNNKPFDFPDFQQATEALNNAKEEFIKTVNDKSKWAALFLFVVSFFLIWVIIYYIYSKWENYYVDKNTNCFTNGYTTLF